VLELAHQTFTSAMTTGFTVAGVLAIGGALIVAIAPPRRRTGPDHTSPIGAHEVDATAPAAARTNDHVPEPARVHAC
jgi:hypothetical protein